MRRPAVARDKDQVDGRGGGGGGEVIAAETLGVPGHGASLNGGYRSVTKVNA